MPKALFWRGFVCLQLVIGTGEAPALANKLAFVVGIDAYPKLGAEAQLRRASADAQAVGDTLQKLGFQVTRVPKPATLEAVLRTFGTFTAAIGSGDTALFYFAGHGISLDDGTYLVPADIPALTPSDTLFAKRVSISERDISQGMRNAGAHVSIVIIDACRDNPFPRAGTRALGATTRGLARLMPSDGVYTLYAAREGQTALDRLQGNDDNPNSVFTRILLKELRSPGVSLNELGAVVRDEVAALAKSDGHDQVPAVYDDLIGARSVFIAGPPPSKVEPPKEPVPARVLPTESAPSASRPVPLAAELPPVGEADPGPATVPARTPPVVTAPLAPEQRPVAPGRPGWIGLRLARVTDEVARSFGVRERRGALVVGVNPNGPSANGGIRPGDIVTQIDNQALELPRDLAKRIAGMAVGRDVKMTVLRRGRELQLTVRIARLPRGVPMLLGVRPSP